MVATELTDPFEAVQGISGTTSVWWPNGRRMRMRPWPIATALIGWWPAYRLQGIRTCSVAESP